MVEVLEYALVVLSSSLFAGASLAVYASYSSYTSDAEITAAFQTIFGVTNRAELYGSSNSTVLLPRSTISCAGGVLSLVSGQTTLHAEIADSCDFVVQVSGGVHMVHVSVVNSWVTLEVA